MSDRTRFERWAKTVRNWTDFAITDKSVEGKYRNHTLQAAWVAWQAGWLSRGEEQAAGDSGESKPDAAGTPSRLFIDCEFNEGRGELISIALVGEDGREFYSVLPCLAPRPWIAENVMPILNQEPESLASLQSRLWRFLNDCKEGVHIVADHPADLYYFFDSLITDKMGTWLTVPKITAEIVDCHYTSAIPHNALEDARAIRVAFKKMRSNEESRNAGDIESNHTTAK